MREIIITRKKRIYGYLMKPDIVLDGKVVARIKNGQTINLSVDDEEHEIYAQTEAITGNLLFNRTKIINSNILRIEPGYKDVTLQIKSTMDNFKLSFNTTNKYTGEEETQSGITDISLPPAPPKSQLPSYLCGIILGLFFLILSVLLYFWEETSMIGLISGVVLSISASVTFIIGGFWFVIIPLPYISIWKGGCLKPNQSSNRKYILGILSFVFYMAVIPAMLIFRTVAI